MTYPFCLQRLSEAMDAPIEGGWLDFCDHLILLCDTARVHQRITILLPTILTDAYPALRLL